MPPWYLANKDTPEFKAAQKKAQRAYYLRNRERIIARVLERLRQKALAPK